MRYQITAVLAALSAGQAGAIAQPADELLVLGTRLEVTIDDTPVSVSIITDEELRQQGVGFVVDALARLPGVSINQNGAFGGQASVRLRGAGTGQTLVLIDGVPVGDPSSPGGAFDFSRLDPSAIERIEVLRGPQSVLWGSSAIGGVVNIVTHTDDNVSPASLRLNAGSFGTVRGSAQLAGKGERLGGRLSISSTSSEGISKADEADGNPEDDGYRATTIAGRAVLDLDRTGIVEARLLHTSAKTDYDGFPPPNFSLSDTLQYTETDESQAILRAKLNSHSRSVSHDMMVGYAQIERRNFDEIIGPTGTTEGERLNVRYLAEISLGDDQRIGIGAEAEQSTAQGRSVQTESLFALYEKSLTHRATISGGVRHDQHETFGAKTTAQVGTRFAVTPGLSLKANAGQGFNAPTLSQLTTAFDARFPANGELKPENSVGGDIGLSWMSTNNRYALHATLFYIDVEDQIEYSFATSNYQNAAQVTSRGVETEAHLKATHRVTLSGNYTYTDANAEDAPFYEAVPEHRAAGSISISPAPRWRGSAFLTYTGQRTDFSGTDLDSWMRTDLSAQYQLRDNLELSARLENVFDVDYQQVSGYGTPGLSGWLGLRVAR